MEISEHDNFWITNIFVITKPYFSIFLHSHQRIGLNNMTFCAVGASPEYGSIKIFHSIFVMKVIYNSKN
jgi:hypothetical protein